MVESAAAPPAHGGAFASPRETMTYGRSRLLLGVCGVGLWVVLAAAVLATGLPGRLSELTAGNLGADAVAIAGLALVVLLVQAPFDLLGGHILPRRHGRSSERFAEYAGRWLRGAAAYQSVYAALGLMLLLASRGAGVVGMVSLGMAGTLVLLALRTPLARLIGGLRSAGPAGELGDDATLMASSDIGFTGGLEGVVRGRRQLVPRRWADELAPDLLSLAVRRRRAAVRSGLWLRGRAASLAFIWVGLTLAATQVGALGGTSGGVLAFAAVFTLWSFAGLLVLPTLSRRASRKIDRRLIEQGVDPSDLSTLASALDAMQDDEPSRPKWIERVFHPIPNVASRNSERASCRFAAWDVARTSAYLGISGLSPLGRAVHCNSGRPSLWVYLPLD